MPWIMDGRLAKASGCQLTCDRRARRYEDGALKDEGKTAVGFNLFDRHKQERTGKGYRQEIKTC